MNKKIAVNLSIWIILFLIFCILFSMRFGMDYALRRSSFMVFVYWLLITINNKWLLPNFLFKKRYVEYFAVAIPLFIISYFLFFFYHGFTFPPENLPFKSSPNFPNATFAPPFRFMISMADNLIGILLFITSIAYSSSQYAFKREKETIALKNENLNSELKFLRSQINPHFLFNALHNIYALSVAGSDKTSKTIIILSDMLRYVLYDCNHEKVKISKEIDYLKNYISLSCLKDENINKVSTLFNIRTEDMLIEPMLLVPFLENSFKHSKIEDTDNGYIDLQLRNTPDKISLELKNSMPKSGYTKDKNGGIGLENVHRRLSLLYPDRHELTVDRTETSFEVKLNILV